MKINYILLLLAFLPTLAACQRQWGKTQHEVMTDSYTLTVSGQRLLRNKEVSAFPKQAVVSSGDTVRLQGEVTDVAQILQSLSEGLINTSDFWVNKGDYVLRLQLVGRPGSDPDSNAAEALRQLARWGYAVIDTNWHQPVALVRAGQPFDKGDKQNLYGFGSYELCVARGIMGDSVGNGTVEEAIDGYMESVFGEPSELFSFLLTHGYDTLHMGPAYQSVIAQGSRPYRPIRLLSFRLKIPF